MSLQDAYAMGTKDGGHGKKNPTSQTTYRWEGCNLYIKEVILGLSS